MSKFAMLPNHHPLRRYFEEQCASGRHYETRESCQAHIENLTEARGKALVAGLAAKASQSEDLMDWLAALERSGLGCDVARVNSLIGELLDCDGGKVRQGWFKVLATALHPDLHPKLLRPPTWLMRDWTAYQQWLIARRLLNDLDETDLHWRGKRASLRIDVRQRQTEIEAWQVYQCVVSEVELELEKEVI